MSDIASEALISLLFGEYIFSAYETIVEWCEQNNDLTSAVFVLKILSTFFEFCSTKPYDIRALLEVVLVVS
jgi:hypothetical protein